MRWFDLFSALGLVLILEGIMPTLNPDGVKKLFASLSKLEAGTLRKIGMVNMGLGVLVLYIIQRSSS